MSTNQVTAPSQALTTTESDALWDRQFSASAPVLDHVATKAAEDLKNVPYLDDDTW